MAKQCIFCGRLLAKEDALLCSECGRSQIEPASGAASSSAIKVKLPPKEFTRADPSIQHEAGGLPGPAASMTPLSSSQRAQPAAPSSRMPKRPARLTSSTPEAATPTNSVEADADASAAMARLADSVKPSAPTPAEEVSTMILQNWREELAQLRKQQEQAEAQPTTPPEKHREEKDQEPPALPRWSADNPSQRGTGRNSDPQARPSEKPLFPERAADNRASQNAARVPEAPRQAPSRPLPRDVAQAPELPRKTPSRPLPRNVAQAPELPRKTPGTPLPQENVPAGEASRRELRVKVWEQEKTIVTPQARVDAPESSPAPVVEQNPLARAALGAEEKVVEIEDLETARWQTPLSPAPASPVQPPAREEKQPEARKESQPATGEEKPLSAPGAGAHSGIVQSKDGVEDQPTMPLPLSEIAKQEPALKIERASTPAPKKWTEPETDDVEDLPTRPMAASPAAPRAPQSPAAAQQKWNMDQRMEVGLPPAPRAANPPSMSGVPGTGPASLLSPHGQSTEIIGDAPASRGRPGYPNAQPGAGSSFDSASLPPLPQGPASLPGNPHMQPEIASGPGMPGGPGRPSTPFPDPFSPRPPSFEPASAPPSFSSPNVSSRDAGTGAEEKPRQKKRTGRVLAVVLLLVLVVGGVAWGIVYQLQGGTQGYQTYQDSSKFNISLNYTPGWKVSVDQAHSTIHLGDTTNTDQVNLVMSAANGQVGDYLNQQATQLGVSSPKTAPSATIGGTSWQALQGTVTQSGATFTIVLYAVNHNNHFYLLEFLAPQVSFNQADQSHFKQIRSSFSFL